MNLVSFAVIMQLLIIFYTLVFILFDLSIISYYSISYYPFFLPLFIESQGLLVLLQLQQYLYAASVKYF